MLMEGEPEPPPWLEESFDNSTSTEVGDRPATPISRLHVTNPVSFLAVPRPSKSYSSFLQPLALFLLWFPVLPMLNLEVNPVPRLAGTERRQEEIVKKTRPFWFQELPGFVLSLCFSAKDPPWPE